MSNDTDGYWALPDHCPGVRWKGKDYPLSVRDSSSVEPPAKFNPVFGAGFTCPISMHTVRELYIGTWIYNPWTGQPRDQRDIESDPQGRLMKAPKTECTLAAGKRKEESLSKQQENERLRHTIYSMQVLQEMSKVGVAVARSMGGESSTYKRFAGKEPQGAQATGSQVGGNHYSKLAIQPVEYIHANNIPFMEGCAIKYLTRWRDKGGVQDLEKAKHFIEMLIELEKKK